MVSLLLPGVLLESAMNSSKLCHELERLKNDTPKIFS